MATSLAGVVLVVADFLASNGLSWPSVAMLLGCAGLLSLSFEGQDVPSNTRTVAKLEKDLLSLRDEVGLVKIAAGVRDYGQDR